MSTHLASAVLFPELAPVLPPDFGIPSIPKNILPPKILVSNPGLLRAQDFVLPEMVGVADGEISVAANCIDEVQLRQVFRLAEVEQETRELDGLPLAERRLEERRYKDFLRRNSRKGDFGEQLEEWRRGEARAEESFRAWWQAKEGRRRTAMLRKANRLANCGVTGRRLDCSDHPEEHRFFGKFNCGNRYCRQCGPQIFADLFHKYMGLWRIVEPLVVRPGFRSPNIISTLDFTARNLGRMPLPREIREFNQDVRACIKRVMEKLGITSKEFLFLWCDEFGGWDEEKQKYNTNLHAHGVFVGPYVPYEVIRDTWIEIRKSNDGARGVFIKRQKIDKAPRDLRECERARFARALGHALKYTGKHVMRSDGERLAELEAAFHGVRRVHTMGLAYHADLRCKGKCPTCEKQCEKFCGHDGEHCCSLHRPGKGCPVCERPLMYPNESGYTSISILRGEGRIDLTEARRRIGRQRVFAGPRGAPA